MKCILTPNPEPPFNLIQIFPAYGQHHFEGMTEDEVITAVIARHRETGSMAADAVVHIVEEEDTPRGDFDSWYWDDGIKIGRPGLT